MESFSLSFQTEEIVDSLNDKFIKSKDRKAWFKNYPEIITEIDIQLRKYFQIGKEKLLFSLYENNSNLKIHEKKDNISQRIIISTSNKILFVKNKKIKLQAWDAYLTDSICMTREELFFRKGKEKEFILIFEYISDLKQITELFKNLKLK